MVFITQSIVYVVIGVIVKVVSLAFEALPFESWLFTFRCVTAAPEVRHGPGISKIRKHSQNVHLYMVQNGLLKLRSLKVPNSTDGSDLSDRGVFPG